MKVNCMQKSHYLLYNLQPISSVALKLPTLFSQSKCKKKELNVFNVFLFVLAINRIAKVPSSGFIYILFVDDLSLSFAASRMSVSKCRHQLSVDSLVCLVDMRVVKIPNKKTAMLFCRIKGLHLDLDLILNGQRISCTEETRFLTSLLQCRVTCVRDLQ